MLATLALLALAPAANTFEVTVRTENFYTVGSGCDPDIVMLTDPQQSGVVESNCTSVTATANPDVAPDLGANEISVRLGKVLYSHCELVTQQRNHYGADTYTAWGFACEAP